MADDSEYLFMCFWTEYLLFVKCLPNILSTTLEIGLIIFVFF